MDVGPYTFSFLGYLIFLCFLCGLLLLLYDAKLFQIQSKKKEYKVAKAFGWMYVILGAAIFIVDVIR